MPTISKKPNFRFRRLLLTFSAVALALVGAALWNAKPSEAASCRSFTGSTKHAAGSFSFSNTYTVPYGGCSNIVVSYPKSNRGYWCGNLSIRFYPRSGGSYKTSPKWACYSGSSITLATNVKDGTRYRIESFNPHAWNDTYRFTVRH